jgi:diguanylate cyclase (GGDEF) domain
VDELTGLTNARTFEALLHEAVARAAERGERLSVVLLDLDGFKWLNDTFGHQAGNEMLKRVAQILRENVRRDDVVARLGGEEMAVMLPGVGLDEAAEVAERVRRAIEQQAVITVRTLDRGHPVSVRVTASLGVATYPDVATSARELMRYADRAMYLGAKRRGRNRVAVYGRV